MSNAKTERGWPSRDLCYVRMIRRRYKNVIGISNIYTVILFSSIKVALIRLRR